MRLCMGLKLGTSIPILRINATASHEKVTGEYSTNQGACRHILKRTLRMRLRKAKTN